MNFNDWLEEHKDKLTELLRNDQTEALFMAWLAGYDSGADQMIGIVKTAWSK